MPVRSGHPPSSRCGMRPSRAFIAAPEVLALPKPWPVFAMRGRRRRVRVVPGLRFRPLNFVLLPLLPPKSDVHFSEKCSKVPPVTGVCDRGGSMGRAAGTILVFATALLCAGCGVYGVTSNDTGGIIPWTPENQANAHEIASERCAIYRKYARITSVDARPGEYIGFRCVWSPRARP